MTTSSSRVLLLGGVAIAIGAFSAFYLSPNAPEAPPEAVIQPGLNLSEPGVAWDGFVVPETPNYEVARLFNDYTNPETGLGPISDGPDFPYVNNEVAREMNIPPTYRVADLTNDAAKNLMPWALEALTAQNEMVKKGENGLTREARCWETGVPAFHLNPNNMHIIQTPKEVVLFLAGRVRHIWMNVPHSANPKPSWYGEPVGHYEGDTLVVDTIGFNDKTFVDSYRTPHTTQLHVIERFRLINNGNTLEVAFTVEDPGTFYKPWSGTRNRHKVVNAESRPVEPDCSAGAEDFLNIGLEPVPLAGTPEF